MARDWTQQEFGITGKEPDAYEQLKSELAKVKKQLATAVEENKLLKCKLGVAIQTMDMETLKQIKELEK